MDISLIITNYNREAMVGRAIRSCLSQVIFRSSYEVIVIDDASKDDSLNTIKEFSKEIKVFPNKTNKGVAYCSNLGLKKSKGKYWMRVDSDDYLNQFACHIMKSVLDENEKISFVYCDHIRVNIRGVKEEKIKLDTDDKLFQHGAGVMFRKNVLDELNGYDEDLRNAEDYDLLVRLKQAGYKGYYLPIPLYRYYIHGKNMTLNDDRKYFINKVRSKYGI
jgi:glycosyltransferase involved in cell wall biosynthesis